MEVIITKRIPHEFDAKNQSIITFDIQGLKEEHKDAYVLDEKSLTTTVDGDFVYIAVKGRNKPEPEIRKKMKIRKVIPEVNKKGR